MPHLVPYTFNHSLLIRDGGHRRYTLFSSDGQTHRSFMPDRPGLLIGTVHGVSDSGIANTLLDAPPLAAGQQTRPMLVRWIATESGRVDTVARFNTESFFVSDLRGTPWEIRVLFTTAPFAAVGVGGSFVIGGNTPEIRSFENNGRLIRILRLAEAPRPVKPKDVKDAIDFRLGEFPDSVQAEARRAFEQMKVPSHWPTFQSIRVDRLGWLWAELFRTTREAPARWMVFDSGGVARGVVDLPPGLEVQDIGADYVLGRRLDDMYVEYVRRYRLDRGR